MPSPVELSAGLLLKVQGRRADQGDMLSILCIVIGLALCAGGEAFDRARAYDHGPVGQLAGYVRLFGILIGSALVAATITA